MAGTAFPVTLLFADGVSQRIAVPCGGKLIEAAQEAGIPVAEATAGSACCAPRAPVARGKPLGIGVKGSGSGCC